MSFIGRRRAWGRLHTSLHPRPPSPRSFTFTGELNYSIEELRLDAVRVLLDARTLLLHVHMFLAVDGFCSNLWDDLDASLGASGVHNSPSYPNTNPFSYLWGTHLPAAFVCLTAIVAHLDPVLSNWHSNWTVCWPGATQRTTMSHRPPPQLP